LTEPDDYKKIVRTLKEGTDGIDEILVADPPSPDDHSEASLYLAFPSFHVLLEKRGHQAKYSQGDKKIVDAHVGFTPEGASDSPKNDEPPRQEHLDHVRDHQSPIYTCPFTHQESMKLI